MRLPESLQQWLDTAAGQMRWKRARPVAAKELADHMEDQYAAFLEDGMEEEAAAAATVREMGDPVETGTRLDRAWRPQPDWVMLGLVLVVAAVGTVVQYLLEMHPTNEVPILAQTQVGIYLIGVVCLFAGYFADYTILGRRCWLLYGAWAAIGLLLTVEPFRVEIMGKLVYLEQWVWFFPVLFAGILFQQRGKGTQGVGICLLSLLGMWFFAMYAPSMTALCVLTVVSCGMLFAAVWRGAFGQRTRGRLALAASPVLAMALYCLFLIVSSGHIREALGVVLHPQSDAMGSGYQGAVAQNIMLGIPFPFDSSIIHSVEAWLWGDSATDWMLMAAKYYWGWAAVLLILAAAVLLLVRGFRLAWRQTGLLARSVCMGVMVTFALQTLQYVLQNFGFILFSAYGLPLLSYGGAYLCQTMLLLGVLLSAQRCGALEAGAPPVQASDIGG